MLKHTPMKRAAPVAFVVTLAFLGGYVYGHLRGGGPVVAAKTARHILYYQCPMHPSYRSDHPGTAPCCNMELQPVYEGDASPPSSAAIHITPRQQELIGVQYGSVEYGPASRAIRSAARVGLNETRVARIQTKPRRIYRPTICTIRVGEAVTKGQQLVSIYNRRAYSMVQEEFLQATMDSGGMALPFKPPWPARRHVTPLAKLYWPRASIWKWWDSRKTRSKPWRVPTSRYGVFRSTRLLMGP